jgi:hypothetical protein
VVHATIDYPGVPVDHSTVKETHGILKNVRIPIRPHFGVIGVAPKEADVVDSIPPGYFGGNIDIILLAQTSLPFADWNVARWWSTNKGRPSRRAGYASRLTSS